MKKILGLFLMLCMICSSLLALSACGGDKDNSLDYLDFTLLDDGTYSVALKENYRQVFLGEAGYRMGEDYLDLNRKTIKIPASYEGKAVTQIADFGFMGSHAASVTIPSSITYIGKNAFCGMTFASNFTIPEGVKIIGDQAFDLHSQNATTVVVPTSLEYLGMHAFGTELNILYRGTAEDFSQIKDAIWAFSADDPAKYEVVYKDVEYIAASDEKWYFYSSDLNAVDLAEYITEDQLVRGIWTFGKKDKIESIAIEYTNTLSGKTYAYTESEVTLTDEYWDMLKSAESEGMLSSVLSAEELSLFTSSANKEEYAEKLETYNASALGGMKAVFADGQVTMYQNDAQYSQPFDYVEVNGTVFYKVRGSYSKLFAIDGNRIIEDSSTEYGGAKHYYELQP